MAFSFSAVVAGLFVLSGMGLAQNLPDAPSVNVGTFPSARSTVSHVMPSTPIAATKPLIDPTVADATYWASTSALFATTFVNVELTTRCSEEHTCLTWIAPGSTRQTLYAYTLPTDVLVSFLSYKLKRRVRWWMVPQVVLTSGNIFSAGRSYGRIR
jgi:hypothetical protein